MRGTDTMELMFQGLRVSVVNFSWDLVGPRPDKILGNRRNPAVLALHPAAGGDRMILG